MNQPRIFRIYGPLHTIQYGYWEQVGAQRRFKAYREWRENWSRRQAEDKLAKLQTQVLLEQDELPPPDAVPIPQQNLLHRDLRVIPDADLVERAVAALPAELPSIEESHARLGPALPKKTQGGRRFSVHLNDEPYRRLCALAVCAGTTRDKFIEALIFSAGEGAAHEERGGNHLCP